MVTDEMGNQLNRFRHGHSDFHNGYSTTCHRIGCKVGILGGTNTNGRNDA